MYFLSIVMSSSLARIRTAFGLSSFSYLFLLSREIQNTFSSRIAYLTGRQKIKDERSN